MVTAELIGCSEELLARSHGGREKGAMEVDSVTLGDAIQPLNLREGKNEEEAVLTSDSGNQNVIPLTLCLVHTSLSFPEDE